MAFQPPPPPNTNNASLHFQRGGITARSGTNAPVSSGYGGGGGGGITRGGGSSDEEDEGMEAPPTPLEDRKLKVGG